MEYEIMLKEILSQLRKNNASIETIEKFEIVWASAMRNSGQPIPCASCFILEEISYLDLLPSQKGLLSERCLSCKTKFEFAKVVKN